MEEEEEVIVPGPAIRFFFFFLRFAYELTRGIKFILWYNILKMLSFFFVGWFCYYELWWRPGGFFFVGWFTFISVFHYLCAKSTTLLWLMFGLGCIKREIWAELYFLSQGKRHFPSISFDKTRSLPSTMVWDLTHSALFH